MISVNLPGMSFGAVSAIVTSVGLIVGFGAAEIAKPPIVAGLLIVGLADNLSDSLSIHIYQESERLEQRAAFRATIGNFVTRFCVSLSFVFLVLSFSEINVIITSVVWGAALLTGLTWLVARDRHADVATEVFKHLTVAAIVVAVSHIIGKFINVYAH